MRLELAERLICPAAHAATPLIVVAHESTGRDLRRALLGCMTCRREGEVREGSVWLGARGGTRKGGQAPIASEVSLLRLAALLGLEEPDALVLLGPRYAAYALPLAERHGAIIAVYDAAGASPSGVGYVQVTEDAVPFASGTFSAAVLDESMSALAISDALRSVRRGGRIVGASALSVPTGVRELARDADGWVGEVEASASPVVPLRRA
jgi:hypothetical protein